MIAETEVVGSEGRERMWMIRIDLRKPVLPFNEMLQSISQAKKEKAKL